MVEALKPEVEMTRAKILKRKKDLSDLQIFLFYIKRVDLLPCFAKGAGGWGLRRPCHPETDPLDGQSKDLGSFLTPKKNIIFILLRCQ